MSTPIYENEDISATMFCGPERSDGGDRTMVQIDGDRWGSGGSVSLRIQQLRDILAAVNALDVSINARRQQMQEITGAASVDKRGIGLIVDRLEALRVRIDSTDEDEEIQFNKEHWLALCREALTEAVKYRHAWDVITANLALAIDANPDDVAAAVRICVRDNEAKEKRIAELENRPKAPGWVQDADDEEVWLLARMLRLDVEARRRICDYVVSRSK